MNTGIIMSNNKEVIDLIDKLSLELVKHNHTWSKKLRDQHEKVMLSLLAEMVDNGEGDKTFKITAKQNKMLMEALYPKDRSKKFRWGQ